VISARGSAAGKQHDDVAADQGEALSFDTNVAHLARVYDYWLGGKDNFAADRLVGDQAIQAYPDIVFSVRANRAFLARAVRFLAADAGIRQFLDVGTGIPTAGSTHEVARSAAADCAVVYADNDPVVLAHARALLETAPAGLARYIHADLRDTEKVLAQAGQTLDFSQPVAVLLMAIMQHVGDEDDPAGIVATLTDALPPGSYLVLSHLAGDLCGAPAIQIVQRLHQVMAQRVTLRDRTEVIRLLSGLELVDPGLVRVQEWRPDTEAEATSPAAMWGAVARKP
jgi:hypothetical protein